MWEIDWYQNERPWTLFRGHIKVTSTIALHLTLNISETVRDRGLVPKDTSNRKWHMDYQMVTWPMTSRDPKVLWGSTVGYPSESLASYYFYGNEFLQQISKKNCRTADESKGRFFLWIDWFKWISESIRIASVNACSTRYISTFNFY